MMISFPCFNEPIEFGTEQIPVVCIENPVVLRQTVWAFSDNLCEENHIIFSEQYEPFSFSRYGLFISDFFRYAMPPAQIKNYIPA